jgi:diguanylate cyclase (GGDEF)-like protein
LYFTAAPLHGADGRVIGAVETLQDISEQKRYEAQLEDQARQDLLTGLANRRVLEERLKQALAQAARDERVVAVAFIDLDHFKPINDELGHAAGDALLRELATRLTSMVRDVDTVARVGGDEFVVVLSAPESAEAVEGVIRRIIDAVGRPVTIAGREVQVGCSVGIALYPDARHGSSRSAARRRYRHVHRQGCGAQWLPYSSCSERAHGAQRDRWINHCRAAVAANVPSTAAIA